MYPILSGQVRLFWQNKLAKLRQDSLSDRNIAMTTGMALPEDKYAKTIGLQYTEKTTTKTYKNLYFLLLACIVSTDLITQREFL